MLLLGLSTFYFIAFILLHFVAYYTLYYECQYDERGNESFLLDYFMTE